MIEHKFLHCQKYNGKLKAGEMANPLEIGLSYVRSE